MKKILRYLTLALFLLFGPVLLGGILLQGMTHLYWGIPVVVIVWAILLGFWYLAFGSQRFRTRALRFGIGIGIFGILLVCAVASLRYDGSASGSSLPKYSWVWEEESADSVDIEVNSPAPKSELENAAGDLHNFLGPERNGIWESVPFGPDWTNYPPELLWRRPVGKAWSSFVVAEGKAFTQEQVDQEERVTCLDLFTGEEIWHHADPDVGLLLLRKENAGARMGGDGPRATPIVHQDRVFSLGATGIVNCLEIESGKLVWTANVITDHGGSLQRWGMANSPLVLEEHGTLVVPGSDEPGATLLAYDLQTGEERWVYHGEGASYSSPRLIDFAGARQIISVNRQSITGHDPATGELEWKYDWPGHYPKVGQPQLVGENRILATASYGAGSPLIEVRNQNDEWVVDEIWKSILLKTKFSSAVVIDGHAYGLDEGRLACIDLEDGDRVWKNQKYGFGQQLLFGEWLLIQTEPGAVVIGRASPEGFEETGRIEALTSMTWNTPAVAGRILLVRNDREAACYLLPPR